MGILTITPFLYFVAFHRIVNLIWNVKAQKNKKEGEGKIEHGGRIVF